MKERKAQLLKVANLLLSESNYAVDIASLRGFCLGANIEAKDLKQYLMEHLGEFPKCIPENFIYAAGL